MTVGTVTARERWGGGLRREGGISSINLSTEKFEYQVDGLVQDCGNSSALAMELLPSALSHQSDCDMGIVFLFIIIYLFSNLLSGPEIWMKL